MTTPIHQPTASTVPQIEPCDLGLPPKFAAWRPGQFQAIEQAVNTDKRVTAMNLPTGCGKSVCGVAVSIFNGGRTVILTSTKGLEDQYDEFSPCGLVDFRGRQNYECPHYGSCADGRIAGCEHMKTKRSDEETDVASSSPGDCTYAKARETFLESNLTVRVVKLMI